MSPLMVISLVVWSIVATFAALYFATDGSRKSQRARLLDADNHDLRSRIAQLAMDIKALREGGGLAVDSSGQSLDDELMPLRTASRAAKPARNQRPESNGMVVFVSTDKDERERIAAAVADSGYTVEMTNFDHVPHYAHELTTAVIVLDLRDISTATDAPALLSAFAYDSLAREVPVFALIKTASEREHIQEDSHYTAAFVAPTDKTLFASTLRAAVIRRRTRARRAEVARSVSAYARS